MVLGGLVAYIAVYTWNARTGILDRLVVASGLEVVGTVLVPGKWVSREVTALWNRYIYLMGVRQENELLRKEVNSLQMRVNNLREQALEVHRLERLLGFVPPAGWQRVGARVVGHRNGANAVLQALIVDKGSRSLLGKDAPVIVPQGVLGRVHRPGLHFSTVLLLVDPNSHIPVMGATNRIPAIAVGQGDGKPLRIQYVPLNDVMPEGEMLITSGLGGMFPKGLPVARVTSVTRSPISLFQDIFAQPVVQPQKQQEVLVLLPHKQAEAVPEAEEAANATGPKEGAL